jgi:adenylate cyclase
MFIKISGPSLYIAKFVKTQADLQDVDKIEKELAEINVQYPTDAEAKTKNVKFDGRTLSVFAFGQMLEDSVDKVADNKVQDMYNSSLFGGINYLDADPEIAQEQLQKDLASLERQIVERENNLIDIDTYMMQLVTGKEGAQLNISHTNAKFVKIADQPSEEEVLEPVKDYFNKLYQDTPGSPDMGDLYTHPEKHRNELSTEAEIKSDKPKFKKK